MPYERLANGGLKTKYGIAVHQSWIERHGDLGITPIALGHDFFILHEPTVKEVMEAVYPGLTYDYAVPQDWWNAMYRQNGEAPHAVWSYPESNRWAGEPIWIRSALRQYLNLFLEELLPDREGQ